MAVGQIIGRVSVKVFPDTSDTRKQTQRKLDAIEKQLRLKPQLVLDDGQARNEALRAISRLNHHLRSNERYRVKFHATISKASMAEAIRKAHRDLENIARAEKVKFGADVAAAVVSGELDSASMDKVKKELEHWRDKVSPLKIGVKPEIIAGTPALVSARLAVLTRPRTVSIVPVLNGKAASALGTFLAATSGARLFHSSLENIWDSVKNLDKAVPIIGTVAQAVAGLAGYGLSAASNLFALSSSLAQIGPLALALPGIIGGLAIGVTAFAVAFKDANKYLGEFQVGLGKKLKAGPAWAQLQDQMSSKFWKSAARPIQHLLSTLFPQLSAGLNRTSTELGSWTAKLAKALTGQFDGELKQMFADLSKSIAICATGTKAFARILKNLGSVGAGYLPRLANWFVSISKRFDAFLNGAAKDGRLKGWVDNALVQLKDLGRVAYNVGSILGGLGRAASKAGGSSLGMMADTLERVAKAVHDPAFQKGLTNTLKAAHKAMSLIAHGSGKQFKDLLASLAKVLQKILPIVGRGLGEALGAIFDALNQPAVIKATIAFFKSLRSAIHSLAPIMPAVGRALAAIIDVAGHMVRTFARSLAPALKAVADAIPKLATKLHPLIDALGKLVQSVARGAAPVLDDLVSVIGTVADGLTNLLKPIQMVVDLLGKLPAPAQAALGHLSSIGLLAGGAMWLGPSVRGKIQGVADGILEVGLRAGDSRGRLTGLSASVESFGSRMSGLRLGAAGAGLAVASIGTKAAGSNRLLGTLASAGGGALMGFSVAGPIGAAIGAGAGALLGLATAGGKAKDAIQEAKQPTADYAATLDELTASATKATKQLIYQQLIQSGAMASANQLGVSARDVVGAVLGQAGAYDRVSAAMGKAKSFMVQYQDASGAMQTIYSNSRQDIDGIVDALTAQGMQVLGVKRANDLLAGQKALLNSFIGEQTSEWKSATKAKRAEILATQELKDLQGKLPKAIYTKIEASGVVPTLRGVARVAKRYDLVPKQIKSLISAVGISASVKDVQRVINKMREAGKLKVAPKVDTDTTKAKGGVDKVTRWVNNLARIKGFAEVGVTDKSEKTISTVQGRLKVVSQTTARATLAARDTASTVIQRVSSQLDRLNNRTVVSNIVTRTRTERIGGGGGGGATSDRKAGRKIGGAVVTTLAETVDRWGSTAISSGRQAMSRVAEGIARSSSVLSETLAKKTQAEIQKANKDANKRKQRRVLLWKAGQAIVQGIAKGIDPNVLKSALQRLGELIPKGAKALQKKQKELLRDVAQWQRVAQRIGAAADDVANKIKQLQDYKSALSDSLIGAANVTSGEDLSFEGIKANLSTAVDKTRKLAALLDKLRKMKLNNTILDQLAQAGTEGGLAAAQSIYDAGQAGVNQLNALSDQMKKASDAAAFTMGEAMYRAGITQAEAFLAKLKKEQRQLDNAMRTAAQALVSEIRRLLGGDPTKKKPPKKDGKGAGRTTAQAVSSGLANAVGSALGGTAPVTEQKVLNYYAAPGSSINAEEDLFAAAGRARMVGF